MKVINVGFIGCGSFAVNMHMPIIMKNSKFNIVGLMDINLDAAKAACEACNGGYFTDDADKILNDSSIDLVFITTRHDSHAELSVRAAKAKKHIMCEKPMALNYEDCLKVAKAVKENNVKYTIGYNRGLAPLVTKAKELFQEVDGKIMAYHRIQAPFPESHWTHIKDIGGGRFVGEGCHIFDLFCRIVDSKPVSVFAAGGTFLDENIVKIPDSANVTITFEDGSVCTTLICSQGCSSFEKEVTEIYCNNRAIYINGFKEMEYYGFEGHDKIKIELDSVDKGQRTELDQLADAIINDTESPNGIDIALRAAVISYKVNESIEKKLPITIDESEISYK
ncbi:MAG: Gfo/Idh/MocA family oxidoreductase [Clostridia bacterium]|nr:Gfo/Idh/MocA family oxidoreductase [Clostridia bacterium]